MTTTTAKLALKKGVGGDNWRTYLKTDLAASLDILDESILNAAYPWANLLTNPGFEVWQRGTGAFTTTAAFTADRWQMTIGTGTLSVSRDSANADTGSQYCAAATTTGTVDSLVRQLLEDYIGLRGRTLTLSVRVKASVASGVRIFLYDSVNAYRYSSYHTGGGAYETITLTLAIPAATTSIYAGIRFSAVGTFYIDSAVLVVGSVAPPYAPLHPQEDLARCQRYYEVHGGVSATIAPYGYATTGVNIGQAMVWRARKAVTPTVTKNGTWSVVNCGQPIVQGAGPDNYSLYAAVTATGAANFYTDSADDTVVGESNP
jgi:hypothetical protein